VLLHDDRSSDLCVYVCVRVCTFVCVCVYKGLDRSQSDLFEILEAGDLLEINFHSLHCYSKQYCYRIGSFT
jgi:hypothetical protein